MSSAQAVFLPILVASTWAGEDPFTASGLERLGRQYLPVAAERARDIVSSGDTFTLWCQRDPWTEQPQQGVWAMPTTTNRKVPQVVIEAVERGRAAAVIACGAYHPPEAAIAKVPALQDEPYLLLAAFAQGRAYG